MIELDKEEKRMVTKFPVFRMLVFTTTLIFVLLLNPLSSVGGMVVDKTVTSSAGDAKTTPDPSKLKTAAVTPTATQGLRKVKLFPGRYTGLFFLNVFSDSNQSFSMGDITGSWNWVDELDISGTVEIIVTGADQVKASLKNVSPDFYEMRHLSIRGGGQQLRYYWSHQCSSNRCFHCI